MNDKYFLIIIIGLVALIIIIANKKTIDGSKGGILEGNSHEQGGIKARVKETGEIISVEDNEVILNERNMELKENYSCTGTPRGIASALNIINGNGVAFDRNGRCIKI